MSSPEPWARASQTMPGPRAAAQPGKAGTGAVAQVLRVGPAPEDVSRGAAAADSDSAWVSMDSAEQEVVYEAGLAVEDGHRQHRGLIHRGQGLQARLGGGLH